MKKIKAFTELKSFFFWLSIKLGAVAHRQEEKEWLEPPSIYTRLVSFQHFEPSLRRIEKSGIKQYITEVHLGILSLCTKYMGFYVWECLVHGPNKISVGLDSKYLENIFIGVSSSGFNVLPIIRKVLILNFIPFQWV